MPSKINNDFYDQLHEEWYSADDHAIALLRAEQKLKNPWIRNEIKSTPFSLLNLYFYFIFI